MPDEDGASQKQKGLTVRRKPLMQNKVEDEVLHPSKGAR
jgi:hypothetical protein